jgi:hypothetical protein
MDEELRRLVWDRAGGRCEYCCASRIMLRENLLFEGRFPSE